VDNQGKHQDAQMAATYLGPAVGIYWNLLKSYGIDPEPVFREMQIDPKRLDDPNARFSYIKVDNLWKRMAELTDDPCLGLKAARFWHPSFYGALGYAWLTSSTLRTAMNRYQRYLRILTEGAELILEDDDENFNVILSYREISQQQPTRTDSFFSYTTEMCRANAGDGFNPVSVSLKHPAPSCAAEFYAYFRCPVDFNAAENRMQIRLEDVDRQLPGSNPNLAQLNDQVMIKYLANLDKSDIINRVKAAIIDQLPSGNVTETTIAEALYLSVRTMQRQLQAEDTSFKAVLNEVRSELADKYIRDNQLSLTEISFMLGFSEMSSFSRAFKRWKGESPSAFRSST
jgi:AraC-like DNA-binding protein